MIAEQRERVILEQRERTDRERLIQVRTEGTGSRVNREQREQGTEGPLDQSFQVKRPGREWRVIIIREFSQLSSREREI